jgi:hypothetical protein
MEETSAAIPFMLHCDSIHKVKVVFKHKMFIKMNDDRRSLYGTVGICIACPMSHVCEEENETDLWYKEINSDGSFGIYVKDAADIKYYVRTFLPYYNFKIGSHTMHNTHMNCYTDEFYSPLQYIMRDGKIIVKDEPMRAYYNKWYQYDGVEDMLSMSRWYGEVLEEVEHLIRGESIFVDNTGQKYGAVAVFYLGEPLKLTRRAVICRCPLLMYYMDVNA